MIEFKKILFPVDLSSVSEKIVPYVVTMATRFDAEVHILFVAHLLQDFNSVYVPHLSVEKFEAEIVEGAKTKLKDFAETHFKGCRYCKEVVVTGDASEEIVKYIKEQEIDMAILGTHGRKGLEQVIFGSVAYRVVKRSPVPVLTVNPYRITKK